MRRSYKIALLDMNAGEPNEGMRCLKMLAGSFLAQEGVSGNYDIFEVRIAGEIPSIEDYDIFISSGGPGSPLASGEVWEDDFFDFLDSFLHYNMSHHRKKHLMLICHSFQLAIRHWDLGKVTKRRSTSFGILPIHKTVSGSNEPLLMGLDDPFYAVDSRDYQVIGPKEWKLDTLEGTVLCREKIRPDVPLERAVMAIRFSKEIFGTQFHPEADAEGMLRYFSREDKKTLVIKKHGNKKYQNMIDHLYDDDKIMKTNHTIIPRFLEIAASAKDAVQLVHK